MGKGGLKSIPGGPPDLRDPPPACRFHPRCEYVMDICKIKEPPLKESELNDVKTRSPVACWLYHRWANGKNSAM
jgi:peptide/nickel transport system ATP-binding protein